MWIMALIFFFFFKQKTAYEMRISDWSSDVCSSDLIASSTAVLPPPITATFFPRKKKPSQVAQAETPAPRSFCRSEEHTSELQSLMRISYAVFCLKKKNRNTRTSHISCLKHTNNHSNKFMYSLIHQSYSIVQL